MIQLKKLQNIRRDYGQDSLAENSIQSNPFAQFQHWLDEAIRSNNTDPTAAVLATVDQQGRPDTRLVLLKEIEDERLIFYTNYQSAKAKQMEYNRFVSLNFYWPFLAWQVRIRGEVEKTSTAMSDDYFATRPRGSQISAIASAQSEVIASREALEKRVDELKIEFGQQAIPRPDNWGGYAIDPFEFEFWQGRDNRLHDRIRYKKQRKFWCIERLAP